MAVLTRRQVVQGAGGLAVAASMPVPARAETVLPIHVTAFDGRHTPSCAFAAEARRLGLVTRDTGGDVTALYTEHLLPRAGQGRGAVAGMTPLTQLFGLRLVVENPRFRLVFLQLPDRGRTFGAYAARGRMAALQSICTPPVAAARLLADWHPDDALVAAEHSNIAAADHRMIDGDALVVWLLAPVARSSVA